MLENALLARWLIERNDRFLERNMRHRERDPGPKRPRGIVLVANDEIELRQGGLLLVLFLRHFLDGAASVLPSGEATCQVLDRLQPHVLESLRGQKGAPTRGAMNDEGLIRRKNRFVIW